MPSTALKKNSFRNKISLKNYIIKNQSYYKLERCISHPSIIDFSAKYYASNSQNILNFQVNYYFKATGWLNFILIYIGSLRSSTKNYVGIWIIDLIELGCLSVLLVLAI
jgi:hypothetical protein